jgi:DNA-binding helix-hairpin-helix protein with protein kinase domain
MVRIADDDLLKVCSWPKSTLHATRNGPIVGILIPRIEGFKEIHTLYSPAQRARDFPSADWAFLVRSASNCARVFEGLHSKRQVIGDVNQSNVLVCKDATVRLIDTDSFQIQENGRSFRCEVGVAPFTPPELQGKRFTLVDRTANHDRFGLAVLIFHLLFMGRHPFAGRPLDGPDLGLERSIHEGRFAYGQYAARKRIGAPPGALSLSLVPPVLAELFETAFLYDLNVAPTRPTAADWIGALFQLERDIKTCRNCQGHRVPPQMQNCPWCELVQRGQPDFFAVATFTRSGGVSIDLAFSVQNVWIQIEKIRWLDVAQLTPKPFRGRVPAPAQLPCVIPPKLPPFVSSEHPKWYTFPPRPLGPELLAAPPLNLVQPQLCYPDLPAMPKDYYAPQLPPVDLPPEPKAMQHTRPAPQRIVGIATLAGAGGVGVGIISFSSAFIVGGGAYFVVFALWWLVLESRREQFWREDLAERTDEWRNECQALRDSWETANRQRLALQGGENTRRRAVWQAEVDRRLAVVAPENQRRERAVDDENARRREEWLVQKAPVDNENERRKTEWHGQLETWKKQCQQVEDRNSRLRVSWELENKPARLQWEALQVDRQTKIARLQEEFHTRQARLLAKRRQHEAIENEWNRYVDQGSREFDAAKAKLTDSKKFYESTRAEYDNEILQKGRVTIQFQKDQYLRKFLIRESGIRGLGTTRLHVLLSEGIETAADIDKLVAIRLRDFGPKRKGTLVKWRDGLLRQFNFNPMSAVAPTVAAQLASRYAPRINPIAAHLKNGRATLELIIRKTKQALDEIQQKRNECSAELMQATEDFAAIQNAIKSS